jgi:hypothetical protein
LVSGGLPTGGLGSGVVDILQAQRVNIATTEIVFIFYLSFIVECELALDQSRNEKAKYDEKADYQTHKETKGKVNHFFLLY